MVRGDFPRALGLSNSCAGELTVANQEPTVGKLHDEVSSVYQLSSVQIRAIIGDLIGAHNKWDDVRADFSSHEPGDLFNWEVILASTEGTLYEKDSLVMAHLGDRYLGEGKKELGLAQLREAYTTSPDNPEALFHLARGLFETKNYVEAEPYLRRFSQDNRISWPRRSLLTLSLAQTELQLGKLSSAETMLQGLATTNDSLRGVHQSLGALYEIQGKLPEAQREYEREFQVSGDIRSRRRALVLERQGGRM